MNRKKWQWFLIAAEIWVKHCLCQDKAITIHETLKFQNDLIIEEPRQRRQTTRYGNQDNVVDMSELETSSDTDDEEGGQGRRGRRSKKRRNRDPKDEDFEAPEDGAEGRYTRAECFRVEKNLLVYG